MATLSGIVRILIGAGLVALLSSPALAVQCNNPDPRSSAIWTAFVNHVQQEYGQNRHIVAQQVPYAYGHALGRLALAVRGNAQRQQAFDCIKLGVDQKLGEQQFWGSVARPDRAAMYQQQQKIAYQASMGFHDQQVGQDFGIATASPLDSVFQEANRLAGHSANQVSSSRLPSRQTGVAQSAGTQNNNYYGVPVTSRSPDVQSSTAPRLAGTNASCTQGDRWSLSQAAALMNQAFNRASRFTGDCSGEGWHECRVISDLLHEARDHMFQTVDQNYDGVAKCRLCDYNDAIGMAANLVDAETWLTQRYFFGAGGLANIYHTIQDMNRDPICKISQPDVVLDGGGSSYPPPPVYDDPQLEPWVETEPFVSNDHPCDVPSAPTQARWKFYAYIFGGGAQSYPEKDGFICMASRNSYRTISANSWKEFKCDLQWKNCKEDPSLAKTITEVKTNYRGPATTKFGHEKGYGVRDTE